MTAADRSAFITAMRQVASSVTVVTTNGPAGAAGATVSAFASLSADPPSVLVCLRSDSRIAAAVAANKVFCVNVLPEDARETAECFAGRTGKVCGDRFHGVALTETPWGAVLNGATAFACQKVTSLAHGTHTIIIGNTFEIHNAGLRPLTYLDGAFHAVRPQLPATGEQQCR
ncbi:flavin oxidoreductase [Leisingera sp. ANG-M1]|uniref:flavin reductase family protein n=1 Tax=Leisingera sp. ANG-M1 TaxID=1577895 RepID=UPI00057C920E|nr:flavin reductase family protein [Leisingera sp. ANG-M1]KIC09320.1 flavin oxidoreductase [Leisingera sp. ANG-M1]